MSDDTPVFGGQEQSEVAGPSEGEHPRGGANPRAIQLETIRALDEILAGFTAQRTSMRDAFRLLATTLEENPSLTPEQRAETYDRYGGRLEESYANQTRATARGDRGPNRLPLGPDSPGENGAGEPTANGEARAPAQNPLQAIPRNPSPVQPRHDGQGGILKRTTDDEGNDRGDYAWNWGKPGGGPPW
jgi:hypothetical protein